MEQQQNLTKASSDEKAVVTTLTSLPVEICFIIFKHLAVSELIKCREICKQFQSDVDSFLTDVGKFFAYNSTDREKGLFNLKRVDETEEEDDSDNDYAPNFSMSSISGREVMQSFGFGLFDYIGRDLSWSNTFNLRTITDKYNLKIKANVTGNKEKQNNEYETWSQRDTWNGRWIHMFRPLQLTRIFLSKYSMIKVRDTCTLSNEEKAVIKSTKGCLAFLVDMGPRFRVLPTHYSLRHGSAQSRALRSWQLFGWNTKEQKWIILDTQNNNTAISTHQNGSATFPVEYSKSLQLSSSFHYSTPTTDDYDTVNNSTRDNESKWKHLTFEQSYRYIKIHKTGCDAAEGGDSVSFFHLAGIEIFGFLKIATTKEAYQFNQNDKCIFPC